MSNLLGRKLLVAAVVGGASAMFTAGLVVVLLLCRQSLIQRKQEQERLATLERHLQTTPTVRSRRRQAPPTDLLTYLEDEPYGPSPHATPRRAGHTDAGVRVAGSQRNTGTHNKLLVSVDDGLAEDERLLDADLLGADGGPSLQRVVATWLVDEQSIRSTSRTRPTVHASPLTPSPFLSSPTTESTDGIYSTRPNPAKPPNHTADPIEWNYRSGHSALARETTSFALEPAATQLLYYTPSQPNLFLSRPHRPPSTDPHTYQQLDRSRSFPNQQLKTSRNDSGNFTFAQNPVNDRALDDYWSVSTDDALDDQSKNGTSVTRPANRRRGEPRKDSGCGTWLDSEPLRGSVQSEESSIKLKTAAVVCAHSRKDSGYHGTECELEKRYEDENYGAVDASGRGPVYYDGRRRKSRPGVNRAANATERAEESRRNFGRGFESGSKFKIKGDINLRTDSSCREIAGQDRNTPEVLQDIRISARPRHEGKPRSVTGDEGLIGSRNIDDLHATRLHVFCNNKPTRTTGHGDAEEGEEGKRKRAVGAYEWSVEGGKLCRRRSALENDELWLPRTDRQLEHCKPRTMQLKE